MKRDILEKDLCQLMAGLYGPFELQQIEYNVHIYPACKDPNTKAEHIIVPTELVLRKS